MLTPSSATADYFGGMARVMPCQAVVDERGSLTPVNFEALGFQARRLALISAHDGCRRGGHAHRQGAQLLVCVSGVVDVEMRHLGEQAMVQLRPGVNALYIASPVWACQTYRGAQPGLLVLSDFDFDPDGYCDSEEAVT